MKKLLIAILLLVALVLWLLDQTISSQPLVVKPDQGSIASAQQVKTLLRKVRYKIRKPPRKFTLRISASEFDALGSFTHRAIPKLRVQTNLADQSANVSVSIALPAPFKGRFFNSQIYLLSSNQGVHVDRLKVGEATLDGQWSVKLAISLADYLMDGLVADLLSQISRVNIRQHSVFLMVTPTGPVQQQLNQLASVFGLEDNGHEREAIRHYHKFLVQLSSQLPKRKNLSLLTYLKPLINEAASRAQLTSAAEENRAALLALGYMAGHRHFSGLIGDFAKLERRLAGLPHQLLLAGRHDLQQHFLYSIIFKLLSDRGVSSMLGELKELMDSGRGGSGFSFADLAADLSGNQFAQYATDTGTAELLQNSFTTRINERWIIPKIDDLNEGLTQQDFKQNYGEVDSPEYLAIVNEIKSRINSLPLYQFRTVTNTVTSD